MSLDACLGVATGRISEVRENYTKVSVCGLVMVYGVLKMSTSCVLFKRVGRRGVAVDGRRFRTVGNLVDVFKGRGL